MSRFFFPFPSRPTADVVNCGGPPLTLPFSDSTLGRRVAEAMGPIACLDVAGAPTQESETGAI